MIPGILLQMIKNEDINLNAGISVFISEKLLSRGVY